MTVLERLLDASGALRFAQVRAPVGTGNPPRSGLGSVFDVGLRAIESFGQFLMPVPI